MSTLIVYYSYMGNTRKIAEMIQKETGGDLLEIKTKVPYSGDYNTVVDQGQKEVNQGYMPELQPLGINSGEYDFIYLGTPVWWYTFAPAVKTYLAQNEFDGKRIYPFVTNGGWIGHTVKDIKAACPKAQVEHGINIRFDEDRLVTSEQEIIKWIRDTYGENQK